MSQYEYEVNRQRLRLKAEEWAKGVKSLHVFDTHIVSSMWYETRPGDGSVVDIEYFDGSIIRTVSSTGEVVTMKEPKSIEEIMYDYQRNLGDIQMVNSMKKQRELFPF